MLVLGRDIAEHRFAHGVEVAVGVEKPDHSFGLLKRLNQPIEENAIEAAVRETDAIVMMLVEGVHGLLPGVSNRKDAREHRCGHRRLDHERSRVASGAA